MFHQKGLFKPGIYYFHLTINVQARKNKHIWRVFGTVRATQGASQPSGKVSMYLSILYIYVLCLSFLHLLSAVSIRLFLPLTHRLAGRTVQYHFLSRSLYSLFHALSKNGTHIKSQLKSRYAKCVRGNWYSRHLCTSTAWQSSNLETTFFPSHLFNMPLAPIRNKYNVSTN